MAISPGILKYHIPLEPLKLEPSFHYSLKSPGLPVRFADGKVINMNRTTRRQLKIFGKRVKGERNNGH